MSDAKNVKEIVTKCAPKYLNCKSCQFYNDGCIKEEGGGKLQYHHCYKPNIQIMDKAVKQLLTIKCTSPKSMDRICAAILLDLYAGLSIESLQLKHADVYGDIGHENSGYATICWKFLSKLPIDESTVALMKWFINFQNGKRHDLLKQAINTTRQRKADSYQADYLTYDKEEFIILEKNEVSAVITPKSAGERVLWGMSTTRDNGIKTALTSYMSQHPELERALLIEPRLFSIPEYKRYQSAIPKEDKPFWLDAIMEGSTLFAMCAGTDKKIIPVSTMSGDVTLKPIFYVDTRKK